jgi:peptidoglycan/LPS O-acetylase OafA/YrhL
MTINKGVIYFGFSDLLFAVAYGWACIVLASVGDKKKTMVGKVMNYGGPVTYGFYMYHLFALSIFLQVLERLPMILAIFGSYRAK